VKRASGWAISSVDVTMSKLTSPDDYIHQGVLEYSADGSTWTVAESVSNQPHVTASLPAGTRARYVCIRDTGSQPNWVVVRELTVVTSSPASGTLPRRRLRRSSRRVAEEQRLVHSEHCRGRSAKPRPRIDPACSTFESRLGSTPIRRDSDAGQPARLSDARQPVRWGRL